MSTIIESCRVPPPPEELAEVNLPLTFFDIIHIHDRPVQRLIFYEIPFSKSYFLDELVPKLKQTLSIALKDYLPLAGNLLYPTNSEKKPIIRYVPGDSVSLTVSETNSDLENLVGNQSRDSDQFYDFVPQFPPLKDEQEYKIVPVFAVKVTLFPGRGLCLGFANHHSVGDGRSIVGFIKSWASICKAVPGEEESLIKPLFDRSVVNFSSKIDSLFWNVMKQIPPQSFPFPLPTKRVRATFILKQSVINKLKNTVLTKKPELVSVSSFVVASTYAWTCLVKSGPEEIDRVELFAFAADCRSRVDPPVPDNYFGNFIRFGSAIIPQRELRGSEGLVMAAAAVAENIKNVLNNKDQVLKGAEEWMEQKDKLIGVGISGLSGSPKFDLYSVDFGWGNGRKVEVISIDGDSYCMSLCRSNNSEGGLEIGLSLPNERMETFAAIFADGLSDFHQ